MQLSCIYITILRLLLNKPDTFGAFASSLCLVHCLLTPLIFVSHSCSIGGCEAAPFWWKSLDVLFLILAFIAIYNSAKSSSNSYVKNGLWMGWVALLMFIVNENLGFIALPAILIHVSSLSLAGLHIYNMNYCQCKNDNCCLKE